MIDEPNIQSESESDEDALRDSEEPIVTPNPVHEELDSQRPEDIEYALSTPAQRKLGQACERFIGETLLRGFSFEAKAKDIEADSIVRKMVYEEDCLIYWRTVNVPQILACADVLPRNRDEFPEDFWLDVAPSAKNSLLWKAREFYTSGNKFDEGSGGFYNHPLDYDKPTHPCCRNYAWTILSIAAQWWNDRKCDLNPMPEMQEEQPPEQGKDSNADLKTPYTWKDWKIKALQWLVEKDYTYSIIADFFYATTGVKQTEGAIGKVCQRYNISKPERRTPSGNRRTKKQTSLE